MTNNLPKHDHQKLQPIKSTLIRFPWILLFILITSIIYYDCIFEPTATNPINNDWKQNTNFTSDENNYEGKYKKGTCEDNKTPYIIMNVADICCFTMLEVASYVTFITNQKTYRYVKLLIYITLIIAEHTMSLTYLNILPSVAKNDDDDERINEARTLKIVFILIFMARTVITVIYFSVTGIYYFFVSKGVEVKSPQENMQGNDKANSISVIQLQKNYLEKIISSLKRKYLLIEYQPFHPYSKFVHSLFNRNSPNSEESHTDSIKAKDTGLVVKRVFMATNGKLLVSYHHQGNKKGGRTNSVTSDDICTSLTLSMHSLPKEALYDTQDLSIDMSRDQAQYFQNWQEDLQSGETYLFYETKYSDIEQIIENGFNITKCIRTRYGKGIYLADNTQTIEQRIADEEGDREECRNRTVIVVRARLGNTVQCDPKEQKCIDGDVDTVVESYGPSNEYHDYVAKHVQNLYPEFLVVFDKQ